MVVSVVRRTRWGSGLPKVARSRQNSGQDPVPTAAAHADTMQHHFAEQTHCVYWDDPKPVRSSL
jgi:hypothetical protein